MVNELAMRCEVSRLGYIQQAANKIVLSDMNQGMDKLGAGSDTY